MSVFREIHPTPVLCDYNDLPLGPFCDTDFPGSLFIKLKKGHVRVAKKGGASAYEFFAEAAGTGTYLEEKRLYPVEFTNVEYKLATKG